MSASLTVTGLAPPTVKDHSNHPFQERSFSGLCDAAVGPPPANRIAVVVLAIPHQATCFSMYYGMALTVCEMEKKHHFLLRTSSRTRANAYRAMPATTNAPTLRRLTPLKRNTLIRIRKGRPDRQRLSARTSMKSDADPPVRSGARLPLHRSCAARAFESSVPLSPLCAASVPRPSR